MKSVFTIDYSKSLAFMIRVCDFDYVNPNITEQNFPKERSDGKANLNFELVPHNRKMSSEEVLADFQTKKLRSATLLEGLYFFKKKREGVPWCFWVFFGGPGVAFGSSLFFAGFRGGVVWIWFFLPPIKTF